MPTAISYSEQSFVLVGFSDGSIAVYDSNYSSPVSVWYNICEGAVRKIKWCTIYYTEGGGQKSGGSPSKKAVAGRSGPRVSSRICEFFVIDSKENFYIWNLSKNIHKPVHTINFAEKHPGKKEELHFGIARTGPDQSFGAAFGLADHSVKIYAMNFKKGAAITFEKLRKENERSKKILSILPTNN